ncbi:MAG: histidine phosphatase family protein [Alphaproteobacteria bacterium]|nr:histidine phosphatase family protein [Alphaproteobacteria bacterium]
MKKDFYIFRHGQSSYNLAGRTQGRTNDSVLTELGREQAREVGQKLKDRGIEVIVTSPLERARETAKLANETLNVPVLADDRFIEVNVGEIEGMHYTEIQEKYGEKYQQWRSLDCKYEDMCFEGGETKKQVRQRVFGGLEDYARNSAYDVIAVSSHGIMLTQVLIAMKVGVVEVKNGAILHIGYDNGVWRVVEWL